MTKYVVLLVVGMVAGLGCKSCDDTAGGVGEGGACISDDECADGLSCIDDVCTRDTDGDGVPDSMDNCIATENPDQLDTDGDGNGDACDGGDNNGTNNTTNNTTNNDTTNTNNDTTTNNTNAPDADGDGVPDASDNCVDDRNPDQADTDGDGMGDACDDDVDGDGTNNDVDNCPMTANPDQADADEDGVGDACDPDTTRRDMRPTNAQCTYRAPVGVFAPSLEWEFSISAADPYPNLGQVMMTPAVANLTDDNADTIVDEMDVPDVIFTTFETIARTGDFDFLDSGAVRAISGDGSRLLWSVGPDEGYEIQAAGSLAVGDIDNDGYNEIIAGLWTGGMIMIEHDGTVAWATNYQREGVQEPSLGYFYWGGPSLADLDGNGDVEIVIGSMVFDHLGQLEWDGRDSGTIGAAGRGTNHYQGNPATIYSTGALSVVADVDGNPATLEIVTGTTVYRNNGTILWENTAEPDGFPAIGDFDLDGKPEVVVSAYGTVRVHDTTDFSIIWGPVDIESMTGGYGGRVGAPTVADFTGDGTPEVGVAAASQYVALSVDLGTPTPTFQQAKLWAVQTQDVSSNLTGSSVFDFEGDGKAEVVYNDELSLRVFDGATGAVLFEQPNTSFTALEYPLIVDVDNDGAAEIVVGTNDFECGDKLMSCQPGFEGIRVFGDAQDNWVATRRIWNQHTYHINNVEEDGTIPQREAASWLDHNTYRLNAQTTVDPEAAPDLIPEDINVNADGCTMTASAWVTNSGTERVGAGLPVSFFAEAGAGREYLGTVTTLLALEPGQSERVTLAQTTLPAGGPWDVVVVVDDADGNGTSTKNECDEDNNIVVVDSNITCPN
mgnify:CR=1 FL=1